MTFRDETGRELFDLPDAPRPDPETPIPPRFLGEYDNLFLSHADRSRIGAIDIADRNFRKGPFFVDGFGQGCWDIVREGSQATLVVEPFRPLAPADRLAVGEEAERLVTFLAPDATSRDVRFEGAFA